jgi:hypothetical protein
MKILNYSKVKLLTDKYKSEGVSDGAIGYVIEVYQNHKYEVEFSDLNGITIAQIVLDSNEFITAEDPL